jgi:hypothetical protein
VEVTLIDTTDGVTRAAIDLTSIEVPPKVTRVRDAVHVPLVDRYITCVLLSTQALTPSGSDVAAVATPPINVAPSKKPTPTFAMLDLMELPHFIYYLMCIFDIKWQY